MIAGSEQGFTNKNEIKHSFQLKHAVYNCRAIAASIFLQIMIDDIITLSLYQKCMAARTISIGMRFTEYIA